MHLTGPALEAIVRALVGDAGIPSPYMTARDLIRFFRQFGRMDEYQNSGFPPRRDYADRCVFELNGDPRMTALVEAVADPRRFDPERTDHAATLAELNRCLRPDGYELMARGESWRLLPIGKAAVGFAMPIPATSQHLEDLIASHTGKCEDKLGVKDFDGAVTNARSLVEAILLDLEMRLTPVPPSYDGDVSRLYKRVRQAMKLEAAEYQEHEAVQQLLRGLVSIIDGLAGMSNDMSDRHAGRHRAKPHHARLAVNAANTFCSFLVDSYLRQRGDR